MSAPQKQLSRRAFLRLGLVGGIAAGLGVIYQATAPVGFINWFRWMMRGQRARFDSPARVALVEANAYDETLPGLMREAWKLAGAPDLRGARVVLKPNLVDVLGERPTYTHPGVTEAMIVLAREQGAESVTVAEGTTFRRDVRAILIESGYEAMLARQNVEFVDLNYDDLVEIPLRGGYARLDSLYLARTVREADVLISLPKLKTHHWTTVSASIKNLFGIVPGIKYGWPKNTLHIKGIPAFLAELLDSLPTPRRAAVVDGIIGLQGDGPLFGSAVESHALVVGTDFLAVDATCARLMGMDPAAIDYMAFAAWAGLGQTDPSRIQVVGTPLTQLARRFQPPPQVE